MKDRLDTISAKHPKPLIAGIVGAIEKYGDPADLRSLEAVSKLALWLHVLYSDGLALFFADMVSNLDLAQYGKHVKGFADSSACAHSYKCDSLVLCATICREDGDIAKADAYWGRLLEARLEKDKRGEKREGSTAKKRWKRNLETGDLFEACDQPFRAARDKGNHRVAITNCFDSLYQLFWMKQAGGSELFPLEKLSHLINERVEYLRENIDAAHVKDFVR